MQTSLSKVIQLVFSFYSALAWASNLRKGILCLKAHLNISPKYTVSPVEEITKQKNPLTFHVFPGLACLQ